MSKVDTVVSNIRQRSQDDGVFGLGRNEKLQQTRQDLKDLNPAQRNEAVGKLTNEDLKALADDVNSGGVLGASGLSRDEKRDLFNDLAQGLSGEQLGRLSTAFDAREDVMALGQAVSQHAPEQSKIDFVKALAPEATARDKDPARSLYSTESGDKQAEAISDVLASLRGDGFARAVQALDDDQLTAVVHAGINEQTHTTPSDNGMPLSTTSHDPAQLNALLDAAATTGNAGVKARLFQQATDATAHIRETNQLVSPNITADDAVEGITGRLIKLMDSDTRGIVSELREQDSLGSSLKTYMKEVIGQDSQATNPAIGRQLAQMQGSGTGKTAEEYFHEKQPNDRGEMYPIHAADLGYFTGAVRAGIDSLKGDQQAQQDQIITILSTSVSVGTTLTPLKPAARAGSTVFTELTKEAIKSTVAQSKGDLDKLGRDFYLMAQPPGSENSAAAEAFKVTAMEVRGQ